MTRIVAVLCSFSLSLSAAGLTPNAVLDAVQSHYNRAKTLQVSFYETYTGQGRPRQSDSGELTLRKPGRMRWDYSEPAGKLFLSDGKHVFLYTPGTNRVEQMPLKESEDMRAPLAFLLGKLDFRKEFRDIQVKDAGEGFDITATAKNDKLPYDNVEMHVAPDFAIRKLVVHGQDKSILTYEFKNEKIDPPVNDTIFRFQLPPGATLVNGETGQ